MIAITLLNTAEISATLTCIIGLVLEITYVIIFTENPIAARIFLGALPAVICVVSDSITFSVIGLIFPDISTALILNSHIRNQALLIYIFTYSTLIVVIAKLIKKDIKYPKYYSIIIFVICSLGVFASDSLLKYVFIYEQNDVFISKISLSTINYIFICVFFSLLVIIEVLGIYFRNNIELQRQSTIYKMEELELANLKESTAFIQGWKHDYFNQLQVISSMLNNNQIDSAKDYIQDMLNHSSMTKHVFTTGNTILDSILSIKYYAMTEAKITFDYSIYLPVDLQMSPINLSTLFINLLDNAIEANCKLETDRFIKLSIRPKEQMLIIILENASDGHYFYDKKGEFKSSKSEKNHGYGMQQIIKTIQSVGGFYKITAGDRTFIFEAAIPLSTKRS